MFKKALLTGFGIFLSASACATDSIYAEEFPLLWSSIVTLTGGVAWTSAGQNVYLYRGTSSWTDYYHYTKNNDVLGSGEIYFGLQRLITPGLIGQLGLGIAGVTDATVSGYVDTPLFTDISSYQYKVNHVRAELKGKLICDSFKSFQPYLSGSFGAAFNNTHNFIPEVINPLFPSTWFYSNTTLGFAYTLGLGVQTMVSTHWQIGAGYEFADLGRSFLSGDGEAFTTGPSLSHLYTNEVLMSVSYLFSS